MMQFMQSILGAIKGTWKIWLSVIAAFGIVWAVYDPGRKWIARWLEGQIIASGSVAPPSLKVLPSHIIAWGVLLGFFLVLVTGSMAVARYRDSVGRSQRDALLRTFRQSTNAADLICEQLFPGTAVPVKKVLSFKEVFTFYENADCHCQLEMVLTADTSDVHFYEMEIRGEPEADSAGFPEDIQLEVTSAANQSLTYLISANEPKTKRVVIFFLPLIRAGASDQRSVTTTYYGPGLMRKLFTKREEKFVDSVKSSAPVPDIEYQFWIKPRMGDLVCTQIGKKVEGEQLDRLGRNPNGMVGWVYHATNVPLGHETKLKLELR
jgi:hypothetical protein